MRRLLQNITSTVPRLQAGSANQTALIREGSRVPRSSRLHEHSRTCQRVGRRGTRGDTAFSFGGFIGPLQDWRSLDFAPALREASWKTQLSLPDMAGRGGGPTSAVK